jgi:hypothetical protein
MARLHIHLLYNFLLILALCVSIGVVLFLLSPQAAEIPSASGHIGHLPLLW